MNNQEPLCAGCGRHSPNSACVILAGTLTFICWDCLHLTKLLVLDSLKHAYPDELEQVLQLGDRSGAQSIGYD